MRNYYNGAWVLLLAIVTSGCPLKGTTKFTGDTTDYTKDTVHSITVSTSGETLLDGSPFTDELRVKMFMQSSFEKLQLDMVRGSGEYLTSLAHLAKIPAERHQAFFEHAMHQYGATVRTGNTTPEQLKSAVLSTWKTD